MYAAVAALAAFVAHPPTSLIVNLFVVNPVLSLKYFWFFAESTILERERKRLAACWKSNSFSLSANSFHFFVFVISFYDICIHLRCLPFPVHGSNHNQTRALHYCSVYSVNLIASLYRLYLSFVFYLMGICNPSA